MRQIVLDLCSGARMFWFDRNNAAALFADIRRERHILKDSSNKAGHRMLVIEPDILLDFRNLPFDNGVFPMVVFDPPHLIRNGRTGWLAKKYGKLGIDWREDIRAGFAEAFRVLKEDGTLIFKWNERDIPVSQVLALTPVSPLIGNRCGRSAQSHWIVFMKPRTELTG
jgi:SAM-dependent methyltransferase